MKKIILSCVIITSVIQLTGCWDSQELNDISVVTGLAIDKSDEYKYKLTVELLNASALNPQIGEALTPSITSSIEGNTIAELSNKLNINFTRRLIYSHLRTVVVNKEVAKEGMLDFMDFLERHREFRDDFTIVISDGSAEDILKIMYPLQRVSALKLNRQLETLKTEWGGDPNVNITDFISALISKGIEPVLTEVKLEGSLEEGKRMSNMQTTELDGLVSVVGLSIFKDMKYIGMMSPNAARTLLWLQGKLTRTSLTVPCKEDGNDSFFSVRVYNTVTNISTDYKDARPSVSIDIDFECRLDSNQCNHDLTEISTFLMYEELITKAVEAEVKQMIEVVQSEYQVDIFGFGEILEREHYTIFKEIRDQWDDQFIKASIDVNVNPKLRRTGIITNSFSSE